MAVEILYEYAVVRRCMQLALSARHDDISGNRGVFPARVLFPPHTEEKIIMKHVCKPRKTDAKNKTRTERGREERESKECDIHRSYNTLFVIS